MATEQDFLDPNYQNVMAQAGAAHPEYQQYQAWKATQPAAGAAPAAGASGAGAPGAAGTIQGQAQAASTYSTTPGAAPRRTRPV